MLLATQISSNWLIGAFQRTGPKGSNDVWTNDSWLIEYTSAHRGFCEETIQTFAALAKKHLESTLKGKIVLTAGLGGMGGAQPLAVTMNEGVAICVEVDETRIDGDWKKVMSMSKPVQSTKR